MGFFRTINKAKGLLNKSVGTVSGLGNKIISGAEKGLHIAGKVADIADDVAGKLTNVPIIGGIAGELRPAFKGAKNAISMGESGLSQADRMNKKFGKVRIR